MIYRPDQLLESILTTCTIQCNKCKKIDELFNTDDYDACEYFFKKGWRQTPNNLYCPKCAKKNLKKNNK